MQTVDAHALTPSLSPQGQLRLLADAEATVLPAAVAERLAFAFAKGGGSGLLQLGAAEVGSVLPPALAWWRDLAARYVAGLCATPEDAEIAVAPPDAAALDRLVADAPPMAGAEYLTPVCLAGLWRALDAALRADLAGSGLALGAYLQARHPAWNQVGRVHFNLAENRKDSEAPFAFLATYTTRLSAQGKAQHQPLSRALAEFSDGKNQHQLLSLLLPVQRAAQHCAWLHEMVESGEIYHPMRWQPADALRLLKDLPALEAAGIRVRSPSQWAGARPLRPVVKASIGAKPPSLLGMDAMLDFDIEVSLDGAALSTAEIEALLAQGDGLQLIRGQWVDLDRQRLAKALARLQALADEAAQGGLPLARAMRLMAEDGDEDRASVDAGQAVRFQAGPWLANTLRDLRQPEGLAQVDPGPALKASLRPYQQTGLRWLYLLTRLGLGACLADDMGLGKTIQVLALLLVLQRERRGAGRPSLLVAPASLLANWSAEAERFAPDLRLLIAHPSQLPAAEWRTLDAQRLASVDLVLTSYGTLLRQPALSEMRWHLAVLDEAQAIKNPGSRQTLQVKQLQADVRIALTGTPVENRLSDLWSIFDFTHPGLLGSGKDFSAFTQRLAEQQHFGPLRRLVRPYILRRLKTDKRVISDLPDKTELQAWCGLSPAQAALYQRAVGELAQALASSDGISRKGLVLAYLMRFKQICNHPSQWLGDAAWAEADSGKFARLRELAEVIAARQEKLLVFTQFRETTAPLAAFLGGIFGREGLVLHGGTPLAQRRERVKRFQDDEATPFFVLSLKAGGAGLNLTAASQVIHFDRWWNPAVENQATDRAYRIGQHKNVLVHKFICQGTVEERIDQLIASKRQLVTDLLEDSTELRLTELSDRELLDLVRLDIHAAQE